MLSCLLSRVDFFCVAPGSVLYIVGLTIHPTWLDWTWFSRWQMVRATRSPYTSWSNLFHPSLYCLQWFVMILISCPSNSQFMLTFDLSWYQGNLLLVTGAGEGREFWIMWHWRSGADFAPNPEDVDCVLWQVQCCPQSQRLWGGGSACVRGR